MRLLPVLFFTLLAGSALAEPELDLLYQTAKIDDLMAGQYDGKVSLGEVQKQGDFGLGTFNRLDGEMVLLQGKFYQIKADGKAYLLTDAVVKSSKTPFAAVTFFETDHTASTDQPLDLTQLSGFLDSLLLNKQFFYSIRIDGKFKYVKTRSVPAQKKPYLPITEVVKTEPTFEFRDVKGTLVGFWCPESAQGMNLPGYHFHFLSEDRSGGGHLLEIQTDSVQIAIDETAHHQLATTKK